MRSHPILFIDFDRTLFDTERFYAWLGVDRDVRLHDLLSGVLVPPNFADLLFPDAVEFLSNIRATYRIVLLSYSVDHVLQEKKIRESGIIPLLDDVVITMKDKGEEAKEYLERIGYSTWRPVFIDDVPEQLCAMQKAVPDTRLFLMERGEEHNRGASALSDDVTIVHELREVCDILRSSR